LQNRVIFIYVPFKRDETFILDVGFWAAKFEKVRLKQLIVRINEEELTGKNSY